MEHLGALKVGDIVEYEISYKNYKSTTADVTIKDKLDPNVEFVDASDDGALDGTVVNWTIKDVPSGTEGSVTLKVRVLKGALVSEGGEGEVVNGGGTTTVKIGNDQEYDVNVVENPVPEDPVKTETKPYKGTGVLGAVKVGDEITYEISYENYLDEAADVTIKDPLDPNVEYVSASDYGTNNGGIVNWTIKAVPAHTKDKVTLTVKVKDGAKQTHKVANGEGTTVKIGDDPEYGVKPVENPVPDEPEKKETAPYQGTGELGGVKVGDTITYEISYENYKTETADITIVDTLDPNVEFVSASSGGRYVKEAGKADIVTWTISSVSAGAKGTVSLTVKVLEGAKTVKKVSNGEDTTVQVGNDNAFTVKPVENPVPEEPVKEETAPYTGTGELGGVKVGEEITYTISYENYKSTAADVVIKDTLDKNVEFVSADNNGKEADGVVTWTIANVAPGTKGTVELKVKVLEGAQKSNGGSGKVANGEGTTVKVGNDNEYGVKPVENPVPEEPVKEEVTPYAGTTDLGGVKVGEEITYKISYENYKSTTADVVIKDTLDKNVEFVSADNDGKEAGGVVTWTIKNVASGAKGSVQLTVKVLEGAQKSNGGSGKVENGGDSTTVKVGNDNEFSVNPVENPVPEEPVKEETAPYAGTGVLGGVKVGDVITYKISYENYRNKTADVVIKDTLDKNVEFVSADNGGTEAGGVVTWTIKNVASGKKDTVELKVRVLEGALESNGGSGKIVNGGDSTTVKVGNDNEFSVEPVENPVPEEPVKTETAPYEGTGELGAVKVGDEITYKISYKNYKNAAADVVVKDTLDKNVEFVSADNGGTEAGGVVTWTIQSVPAGQEGSVSLTVKVLEGAKTSDGKGKVENGGDGVSVKVGNDFEYHTNVVENPVPENPKKEEVTPFAGTGTLGSVKVGQEITYKITYRNYKSEAADVVIKDTLDKNVQFVKADNNGTQSGGVVTWTIKNVPAGQEGSVTLTVKVLEGALKSKGGPDKVLNGGDNTTVKVGNDSEYSTNTVENPVEPNEAELTLIKRFAGEKISKKAMEAVTFTVKNKDTGKTVGTYKIGNDFKKDSTGRYSMTIKVEPGTYEVTESSTDVKGYSVSDVFVADGKSSRGSAQVTVPGGGKKTVTVTNTYKKSKSSKSNNPGGGSSVGGSGGGSSPKTGDNTPLTMWILMMLAALAVCTGAFMVLRRRRRGGAKN